MMIIFQLYFQHTKKGKDRPTERERERKKERYKRERENKKKKRYAEVDEELENGPERCVFMSNNYLILLSFHPGDTILVYLLLRLFTSSWEQRRRGKAL